MRVVVNGSHAAVTLSVRNLQDLLAQAQSEFKPGFGTLVRGSWDGSVLLVNVEPDSLHYVDREPGVGSGLLAQPVYNVRAARW